VYKPAKENANGDRSRLNMRKSESGRGFVNYCPVCKREYKEMSGGETRHCPVCGSRLIQISDEAIMQVRQESARKRNSDS